LHQFFQAFFFGKDLINGSGENLVNGHNLIIRENRFFDYGLLDLTYG
jgi:hypothetical protein